MKLHIRHMVSTRCKTTVKTALDMLGILYLSIELGEVEMKDFPNKIKYEQLKEILLLSGLELMSDKKAMLIEKIKTTIIDMVHYTPESLKIKNSNYISAKTHYDYTYLANIFSEETGITIEHYIIINKIERVKELIRYDELNLTEISYLLNYSSVAHLSRQFKNITGSTPSFFKHSPTSYRVALENL